MALSVAAAWRVHRWAEQTVRLGAVARLSELAAHGSENTKKYAAGALRNMQVRLLELPPDQLKALTPKDDKPKPMFSRESPLDQARALALFHRSFFALRLSFGGAARLRLRIRLRLKLGLRVGLRRRIALVVAFPPLPP